MLNLSALRLDLSLSAHGLRKHVVAFDVEPTNRSPVRTELSVPASRARLLSGLVGPPGSSSRWVYTDSNNVRY